MRLRSNLFIRVFIAFWLVTVATLGSWLFTSDYFESQPPHPTAKENVEPHQIMLRMLFNFQNLNGKALSRSVDKASEQYDMQIYLLNRRGEDMFARKVPRKVKRMATTLQRNRRRSFVSFPKQHSSAYRIRREDEGMMTAVFVFPKERRVIVDTLGSNLWLRIALAVIISGVVCFGLSRLVTNRIRDLQLASRRIAGGDLATRIDVRQQGGDETDELARDFNSMAEQLEARTKAQKRLLGDVSHELRSPLARLRLSLALAQENNANREAYLQRIEQETERLEELVSQLLASQAQAAEFEDAIDLVALLEKLCSDASFEGKAEEKTVSFHTDQERVILATHADLLRRCFENILRNAVHHTENSTRIETSLESTGSHCRVTIEDQGPGLPEAELSHIFDEFYRSDSARSRDSGGVGLGLAIARRAVDAHGGTISARNTGTGLQIIVELPFPALAGA